MRKPDTVARAYARWFSAARKHRDLKVEARVAHVIAHPKPFRARYTPHPVYLAPAFMRFKGKKILTYAWQEHPQGDLRRR